MIDSMLRFFDFTLQISPDKLQELENYLALCMPFGTPIECNPSTIKAILTPKDSTFVPKFKVSRTAHLLGMIISFDTLPFLCL